VTSPCAFEHERCQKSLRCASNNSLADNEAGTKINQSPLRWPGRCVNTGDRCRLSSVGASSVPPYVHVSAAMNSRHMCVVVPPLDLDSGLTNGCDGLRKSASSTGSRQRSHTSAGQSQRSVSPLDQSAVCSCRQPRLAVMRTSSASMILKMTTSMSDVHGDT
jgi:hypothetical protein